MTNKTLPSININKIGTKIKLSEDIYGTIIGCCIKGDSNNPYITYECSWWNGRSNHTQWFASSEIEVANHEKIRIGFF